MILTCPACDTKYVVKDDAIPPGGRQVRCASCKHSWHQDSEAVAAEPEPAVDFGAPPPASGPAEEPAAEIPVGAEREAVIAAEPQPEIAAPIAGAEEVAMEEAPAVADEWRAPALPGPLLSSDETVGGWPPADPADSQPAEGEEEFVAYAPIDEYDEKPRRRWPLLLGLLALIIAAAAAFWFLAPPEWKARAGIAQANATPLQLMITTSDRQPLESGNELVAISGRVINPTDQEQQVPPIRAELRDRQTKAVVHRWTIAPPARVLAPRSSASFNSAEVDVPRGGDELTVTLGGQP